MRFCFPPRPLSLALLLLLLSCLAAYGPGAVRAAPPAAVVPSPAREFRGVWVATVDNIDWPSRPGLPAAEQQRELRAIMDQAVETRLNAVVFQVRPACDAFYSSRLEPWSEFLTGKMGQAPDPPYDPLALAVEEAHRRGLELHAWFNPYRARHPAGKSEISADHISRQRPELVRTYGRYLWLDPGDEAVRRHSLEVIRDVVRRYDIDGVHIDDYFYPYKEKDAAGQDLPFPDDPSWKRYQQSGGRLSRDDWRRSNVDQFIERLYRMVKQEKRWVKFGISPFGIWRPGNPPQIQGFDAYAELYADARKWFHRGWLDYFAPQLYWPVRQVPQSYPVLLKWWAQQNRHDRHLWPGNYTSRIQDGSARAFPLEEIGAQVACTRAESGAGGNIHFSMKAILQNRAGLREYLPRQVYTAPALVPASPWLDSDPPARPRVKVAGSGAQRELRWEPRGREKAWQWVVRVRSGARWTLEILPAERRSLPLPASSGPGDLAAVSAVDRCGNEGEVATAGL